MQCHGLGKETPRPAISDCRAALDAPCCMSEGAAALGQAHRPWRCSQGTWPICCPSDAGLPTIETEAPIAKLNQYSRHCMTIFEVPPCWEYLTSSIAGAHSGARSMNPNSHPSPTFPAAVRALTQHSKRCALTPDTCPPFQALGLFVRILPRLWHVMALLCSCCCLVSLLPLVPGSPCRTGSPGCSTHAWGRC